MALTDITIDFDLSQLLGSDFDSRRTKAYVTTNVESGTLMDTTTGETRLGGEAVTIASDGTGSFTTWATGADGNPISWQTSLVVDYPRTGQRDRVRRIFGPWTLVAANDGDNITDLEDEQAVPAEYLTTVTAELQAMIDEGLQGPAGDDGPPGPWLPQALLVTGRAYVADNILPPGLRVPQAVTLTEAHLLVGTAPTGASLIVVVKKGVTTLATLTLTATNTTVSVTGLSAALSVADVITFNVTQVGSTLPGSDVEVALVTTT